MTTLAGFEAAALAGVSYIVDSLWQGVLIVLLAAAAIRVFRRANATTRYAIWYIALLAVVVVPAITVGALAAAQHRTAPATVAAAARDVAAPATTGAVRRVPAGTANERGAPPEPARPRIERPRIALPSAVTFMLAALWIAGALFGLLRIVLGYAALAKLQRDALPLPPAYRDGMPLWEESMHRGGRETRLCVSAHVAVPVAVGLFDGMILMPDHLLASFDHADIDRFSLHEMAHLQRRDDWTCAFERIACAVLFFNPAVRWIARQLDLEREVACDDWVVSQTREVRPYAVGLTKMAQATPWPHRPVPAPAIFASRKSISIRIERLLNKHRDVRPTIASGPAAACAVAIFVVSIALLPVAPVIGNVVAPAAPVVAQAPHPARAARASHSSRTTVRPAGAPKAPARTMSAKPVFAKAKAVALAAQHPATILAPTPPRAAPTVAPQSHAAAYVYTLTAPKRTAVHAAPRAKPGARTTTTQISFTSIDPKIVVRADAHSFTLSTSPASVAVVASADAPHVMAAHTDLLDALNAAGYSKLTADEIIALHDNGVSGRLLIATSKYFEKRATVNDVIALARSGVSPAFLEDLGRRGVRASPAEVISFLYGGVSASYAADVQRAVPGIGAASIVQLAQHGVSARLVSGLKERGYDLSVPAVIEFSTHGVPLSYVDALNAHRNPKFTLDEIVKLHDRGVTADAPTP
jgi:beta-lactamase regulating signal transducer with metallopeptidase domain